MASYLDKTKVPVAVTDKTKLDLGHQHITTSDFFEVGVSAVHELVPGSSIDVNMESFARLNPLPVPSFARASMRSRAFFVPFRTIFRGFDDFMSDTIHIGSDGGFEVSAEQLSSVPVIYNASLVSMFITHTGDTGTSGSTAISAMTDTNALCFLSEDTDYNPDFVFQNRRYTFTVLGRQVMKLLESLGYKVNWVADDTSYMSAMPLLALGKIYVDYFYPTQYFDTYSYNYILSLCNKDITGVVTELTAGDAYYLLKACAYSQYDSDLFTSAWDVPNQPNGYQHSDFKLVNYDSVNQAYVKYGAQQSIIGSPINGYVSNNSGSADSANTIGGANAPFIVGAVPMTGSGVQSSITPTPISEYLIHGLNALTDFMKRNQLAGARSFDRMLARYGKAIPAEKLNRSIYLGSFSQDIQIGDVMSTSDTVGSAGEGTGSQLGGMAGKGISYGQGHFNYSTDEFGYFIVITTIVPHVIYSQGIDPLVKRTRKTELYVPEMDCLGVEPLTADVLFIPQEGGALMTGNPHEQIFGWVPRYAGYKQSTTSDRITGNFRLPSINGGSADDEGWFNASSSWHMQRTFSANGFQGNWSNAVHSLSFVDSRKDVAQYKRLFYYTEPDAPDNFTIIHNFEIAEWFPGKSLYDTYDFHQEKDGKKVTMEVNGVKMN